MPQDGFGNAADDHTVGEPTTTRAERDQVRVLFVGMRANDLIGLSVSRVAPDLDARR
jgi:hypothetical protein